MKIEYKGKIVFEGTEKEVQSKVKELMEERKELTLKLMKKAKKLSKNEYMIEKRENSESKEDYQKRVIEENEYFVRDLEFFGREMFQEKYEEYYIENRGCVGFIANGEKITLGEVSFLLLDDLPSKKDYKVL